ncbi:MAG: hypothetical protein WCC06_05880 [Candidatus Aminicenantales bacterium]
MNLNEIVETLKLQVLQGQGEFNVEVSNGYTSDLLSDVMAHSREKNIWITLQIHPNIVAVAKLKDLAAILLVNDRKPDAETLNKAKEENVPLLGTRDSAFVISGKLFELIGGRK